MKFTDGFMIHSGQPARDFVDYAVRHVLLKQGVLGIKVKMYVYPLFSPIHCTSFLVLTHTLPLSMKGTDPEGQLGPRKSLPDHVQIYEPPVDKIVLEPLSEQKEPTAVAPPVVDEPAGGYLVQDYPPDQYEAPVF